MPPAQWLRDTAVPPGRDDVLDVETDAYIHCVSAFVKLAQSEYQLLADIIPEHHQKKTFDSLIQVLPACRLPGALTGGSQGSGEKGRLALGSPLRPCAELEPCPCSGRTGRLDARGGEHRVSCTQGHHPA